MSLFYDRSDNLGSSIDISGLSFSSLNPVYGSRVSFESKATQRKGYDGYISSIPNSLNNLSATFEMRYDVKEGDAQKIVRLVETSMNDSKYGFSWQMPSEFYRTIRVECKNYAVNHISKNHYEVALSLESHRGSPLLEWKQMSFINTTPSAFNSGTAYEKGDICTYGASGLDMYYYAKQDSSGAFSTGNWGQDFFFAPDISFQNNVEMNVETLGFNNSFKSYYRSQKHISALDFTYKFSNLTDKQAISLLHFLESKAGYRRFEHTMQSIYTTKPKIFFAPSWGHVLKYKNSHDIDVRMIEDPMGVLPTNQ